MRGTRLFFVWGPAMPATAELLDCVRKRNSRTGLVTADRYFREVEGCFDGGVCPIKGTGQVSETHWRKALEEAESRLTYTGPGMRVLKRSVTKAKAEDGILQFDAIVTTPRRDRDGDILDTKGARLDLKSPLLWQHMGMSPIGATVKQLSQTARALKARFVIGDTALGRDAATLVKLGALRISHGFDPTEFEALEDDEGYLFKAFDIFEVSLVSIPSNVDAVITSFDGKSFHSDLVKGWYDGVRRKSGRRRSSVATVPADVGCRCDKGRLPDFDGSKERDSRVVQKDFDVERQHLEASRLEYDWISRYCSCEVKQLVNLGTFASRIKMGSFLTGLRIALKDTHEVDARRLTGSGLETPLEYETIQLNSRQSDHFLVDGISFRKMSDGTCFAVKLDRGWGGEGVEIYSSRKDQEKVASILSDAWKWADDNNFLKGEAFSLCGEFLAKTSEEWGDLFLDPANEREVKRSVDLLNSKGKGTPNRGQVFMGPPGTGKTLAGRLMRNHADATFIWVAGKDSYYFGGTGAILESYELAKELAPAIVFMEDIDASFGRHTVDVLKGEMDGIGRSSGIITVLTTNHPQNFPEALLDRPGRFHDVLKFDLPDEKIRKAMLTKWMPEQSAKARATTVEQTKGYSGAHLYELCQYAKSLQETDELDADASVVKALQKISDQRELIDQELMRDRTLAHRRRNHNESPLTKRAIISKSFGADGAVVRNRPFSVVEREYFAELAKRDANAQRRAHRHVSLILRASEEHEEAKEFEDVLSLFS